jgi:hypothetical protein
MAVEIVIGASEPFAKLRLMWPKLPQPPDEFDPLRGACTIPLAVGLIEQYCDVLYISDTE